VELVKKDKKNRREKRIGGKEERREKDWFGNRGERGVKRE